MGDSNSDSQFKEFFTQKKKIMSLCAEYLVGGVVLFPASNAARSVVYLILIVIYSGFMYLLNQFYTNKYMKEDLEKIGVYPLMQDLIVYSLPFFLLFTWIFKSLIPQGGTAHSILSPLFNPILLYGIIGLMLCSAILIAFYFYYIEVIEDKNYLELGILNGTDESDEESVGLGNENNRERYNFITIAKLMLYIFFNFLGLMFSNVYKKEN